jgi:hypothetical protein
MSTTRCCRPATAYGSYHEAKLSADLRDLDEAEAGYQRVLNDPATPPELR